MEVELEAKWLNVNHDAIRKKLRAAGATLIHAERLMSRNVFDFPDSRLQKAGGWVRVRNEGDKITLSYKQLSDRTVQGTKEVTVVVNDYKKTCAFLESIGLKSYSYQETRRESWDLNGAEIELDTWPWIPSFVEIEAANEQQLKEAGDILGLSFSEALHGSVETAYQAVYDVSEEEIDSWESIVFSDVPAWLAKKKKSRK